MTGLLVWSSSLALGTRLSRSTVRLNRSLSDQTIWPKGLVKLMGSQGLPTPPPDGELLGMRATTAVRLIGVVALVPGTMLFTRP